MRLKKLNQGFTLIEILIVLGIFGLLAVFGTQMFISILTSSRKTKALTEVKQNGSFALGVMERMIRNARSIEGIEGLDPGDVAVQSNLIILNPDGETTIFSCEDSDGDTVVDIASGSASLAIDPVPLIGGRVKVDDCASFFQITKGMTGTSPDSVKINFTLSEAALITRPEDRASAEFKTSITLRNYSYRSTSTPGGGAGGPGNILVYAMGLNGGEPMDLLINDVPVESWTLTDYWQSYSVDVPFSSANVKVYFHDPDPFGPDGSDIRVQYVRTNGVKHMAADQQENTAAWEDNSCGGSYKEMMYCRGYINFKTLNIGG